MVLLQQAGAQRSTPLTCSLYLIRRCESRLEIRKLRRYRGVCTEQPPDATREDEPVIRTKQFPRFRNTAMRQAKCVLNVSQLAPSEFLIHRESSVTRLLSSNVFIRPSAPAHVRRQVLDVHACAPAHLGIEDGRLDYIS